MKFSYCFFFFLLIVGLPNINAQSFQQFFPEFNQNGQLLKNATAGGVSSPQFSEVDLNNDGIQDLYIFDKIGQIGLTFLNNGTANEVDYQYAPSFQTNFPTIVEWAILRDYNGDGIQDIFAYSSTPGIPGIEVYTGYYDTNNQIAFEQNNLTGGQFNIIYYPGNSGFNNLFVSAIDYPAIDDIDGDGDLDIITFNVAGGIVEFYENQSVEQGFGLDSLRFQLEDRCWGRFFESGITQEVELGENPETCALNFRAAATSRSGGLHAGSTILTIDLDNDGDKEVILGDISFTNLNLVTNGGTAQQAFMTEQDIAFPSADVPVNLPLFPAAFSLDVNNDGLKDLLVSPNLGNDIGETYEAVWYYQNTGTEEIPQFELQQKDLLVEEMIDFGTGAQPVFVDFNQDGLQDLVVGNKSFFVPGGNRNARVYLYQNIGTVTTPVFELIEDDLFTLNQFSQNAWRFTPTFGDLDNDGDLDALIGEEFGNLFFAENIAGPGQPFEFATPQFGFQNIDVGQSSRPQIIDMNRDGLPDLVIGERNGNLNYYENTGTPANPVFPSDPTNNFFGQVDARGMNQVTGFSVPSVLEIEGEYQLLVGNEDGRLLRYDNIEGNLAGAFTQTATNLGDFNVGQEIHPVFNDIDNDGFLEMAVGNLRGGISFFQTDIQSQTTSTSTELIESEIGLAIVPNPATHTLSLQINDLVRPEQVSIYALSGQLVLQQTYSPNLAIGHLPNGMYLLEISTDKGQMFQKFVKQ